MDDEKLFLRATNIQHGRQEPGLWVPIMRRLMPRGHTGAMAALGYLNRGDMLRFRMWARRGAREDYSCGMYTKHFETRLPRAHARRMKRHRPAGKRDEWA